jgi:hypothetical protein
MRHPSDRPALDEIDLAGQAQQMQELRLGEQIYQVARSHLAGQHVRELFYSHWDWDQGPCRSLELDAEAFSLTLMSRWVALLKGEFAHWRIDLNVHLHLAQSSAALGRACLTADGLQMDAALHALLMAAPSVPTQCRSRSSVPAIERRSAFDSSASCKAFT